MAEPIIWQIMTKIKTALDSITTANGYVYDTTTVYRDPRPVEGSQQWKNLNLVFYADNSTRDVESEPLQHAGWRQGFGVDCIVEPADTDLTTTPNDQVLFRLYSDVSKALMANAQWDGLAIDTEITPPEFFEIDGDAIQGITCRFDVQYRTLEGDYTTQ